MYKPWEERFWCRVETTGDCLEWQGTKHGSGQHAYGIFYFEGKRVYAHRFIAEQFYRPLKPKEVVCHSCDNPTCINPQHLFIGTQVDNVKDMWDKGRGDKSGLAIGRDGGFGRIYTGQSCSHCERPATERGYCHYHYIKLYWKPKQFS